MADVSRIREYLYELERSLLWSSSALNQVVVYLDFNVSSVEFRLQDLLLVVFQGGSESHDFHDATFLQTALYEQLDSFFRLEVLTDLSAFFSNHPSQEIFNLEVAQLHLLCSDVDIDEVVQIVWGEFQLVAIENANS